MKIGFKTTGYSRNYDLLMNDDSYVTDYDGDIFSLKQIGEAPNEEVTNITMGEFSLTVFNLHYAREFNQNPLSLIKDQEDTSLYGQFYELINDEVLDLKKYKKIVLLHTYFLFPEYRNKNVTEHLIEFLYKNHHSKDVLIMAFVVPFQYNNVEFQCFNEESELYDDFELEEFLEKTDDELNYLNLYKLAARYGFKRINESNFFYFTPKKIINLIKKRNESKKLNIYH